MMTKDGMVAPTTVPHRPLGMVKEVPDSLGMDIFLTDVSLEIESREERQSLYL